MDLTFTSKDKLFKGTWKELQQYEKASSSYTNKLGTWIIEYVGITHTATLIQDNNLILESTKGFGHLKTCLDNI